MNDKIVPRWTVLPALLVGFVFLVTGIALCAVPWFLGLGVMLVLTATGLLVLGWRAVRTPSVTVAAVLAAVNGVGALLALAIQREHRSAEPIDILIAATSLVVTGAAAARLVQPWADRSSVAFVCRIAPALVFGVPAVLLVAGFRDAPPLVPPRIPLYATIDRCGQAKLHTSERFANAVGDLPVVAVPGAAAGQQVEGHADVEVVPVNGPRDRNIAPDLVVRNIVVEGESPKLLDPPKPC